MEKIQRNALYDCKPKFTQSDRDLLQQNWQQNR